MYTRPESEDSTEGQRMLREYRKEKPSEFVRQMAQMELQHQAKKAKKQDRLISPTPGTEEEEDDGSDRARGLLDRALEGFDEKE